MSPSQTASPPGNDPAARLRRMSVLIGLGIFATSLVNYNRLARLPLRSIIKDDMGLPPEAMASFFALAGLASYLKPLAGALSDHVPILGTRRRPYLLISAFGGAAVWTATAFMPRTYDNLLAMMIVLNVMVVLGNTTLGGLLVDCGQAHGATGRLSAVKVTAMNGAMLMVGPVGGWLAGRTLGVTCLIGATMMLSLVACILRLPPEEPRRATTEPGRAGELSLLRQLRSRVAALQIGRAHV